MFAATLALMLIASSGGTETASSSPTNGSLAGEDLDRVICRRAEPVLGSRIARRRICRTVAQWRAFEEDRQQMRRDMNAGNCAGARSCSENSNAGRPF